MLIAIIGDLGSGKTLTLTYLAWVGTQQKIPVYSNYNLAFKHRKLKHPRDLGECGSGLVALDEAWLWADARIAMSKVNRFISLVILQSRKRNLNIAFTTQTFRQIDVRIRNITDLYFLPDLQPSGECLVDVYKGEQHLGRFAFYGPAMFDKFDTTELISAGDLEGPRRCIISEER